MTEAWEGPYCYDATDQSVFKTKEFPFSEEGIQEAMDWFNQMGKEYNKQMQERLLAGERYIFPAFFLH